MIILYDKNDVTVVQKRVIIDNTRGKIELVFIHTLAFSKVETIFIESDNIKDIIIIIILQISHANKLHSEFIVISHIFCFLGSNHILSFVKNYYSYYVNKSS
ncbi:MAG: hypothetical protein P1U46_01955 [Patescibacteria group bacterium]|nr:hypothetical protein [Patescibacteria group bacterium]